MNYLTIDKDNMLNGTGLRTVLWVSGCPHHCKGCHNEKTSWDPCAGVLYDDKAEKELFENLEQEHIEGISFLGGEPLAEYNVDTVTRIAKKVRETLPNKTIWCYTGSVWDKVKDLEIMQYVDVLVDGPFVESLKNDKAKWRGSTNQRVILVQETLKSGEIVLHEDNQL